ncbi:MAG: DNA polymerase I [Chitinophagia bacterium]|nr:DNA polymerase I [Chitinophagia bacterium]
MATQKLFLLDAYALIFRAYYALIRTPRTTSKGKNTNAQFGFTNTLYELLTKEKPTHLAVVFDTSAPTERHTDFADYKANRQETPEDLRASIPDIERIINGFNLPCLKMDGYEADDIIGTLAQKAAKEGFEVYMVTPDKDYGQVVSEKIFIYKPAAQGNGAEILGVPEVLAKWGISRVEQVIDMLGLMGDAVDNIPGIAGVGEKTAAKLLAEYGSLENILDNAASIKGALGEKVRAGKDNAILSKKLATIIVDVPIAFEPENYAVGAFNKELLEAVFNELEFKTLGKRILGEVEAPQVPGKNVPTDLFSATNTTDTQPANEDNNEGADSALNAKNAYNTPHDYRLITTIEEIDALIAHLMTCSEICFDSETTHIDANLAEPVGMSFCTTPHTAYYVALPHSEDGIKQVLHKFNLLFEREEVLWIGQNIKYDFIVLKWYGFEVKGKIYDTMLANYVIEPDDKRSMDMMSLKYLNYLPISIETLIGKKGKNQGNMRDVEVEKVKEYAAEDADITLQLKHVFTPMLAQKEVSAIFDQIENPLIPVLVDMECEGVKLDVDFLKDYHRQLDTEIAAIEKRIYDHAQVPFNIGSPKQLGEVLFEIMKIDSGQKKTKTGQYATGEDVLQKLRHKHPIVDEILNYRETTKLQSTYVATLPQLVNPRTGRLHTSYNQAVAVTGRLSSNNPNLQNIPIKTERGKEIRKAFIPRDANHCLISADYSQIELRIIAAISGDTNMINAFIEGKDIHTATAAKVYGVPEADVTSTQRRAAKAVNFGIIYGQSAFGLAENLGISRTEAKGIIDNYFTQYPLIKQYMDKAVNDAKERGYAQTVWGRKRWLKDIYSANFTVRGYAERNAINMPIQGTAADMIKLAMIAVHQELKKSKLQTKMILQVHDELVFDVPKHEADDAAALISRCMEAAMPLPNGVPVKAETGTGINWLEAH